MIAQGISESRVYPATTSGSTGTPFRVLRGERKQVRIQTDSIYWGRLAAYEVGQPLFYMRVWSGRNQLSRIAEVSQHVIPVDAMRMQAEDYLDVYDRMIGSRNPLAIIAYTSVLESLLRALESGDRNNDRRDPPKIAGIIAQSEELAPDFRTAVAKRLGRMVYGRYGLEELGIVGQQVPGSGERYLVNSASRYVEVLDLYSDEPAQPGTVGRIVVTDLINDAQPMISYDTGDLGSFNVNANAAIDTRWMEAVAGRRMDQVYDVDNSPMSRMLLYKIWWRFPEIRQYQLIQRGKGDYVVRLNVGEQFVGREPEFVRAFIELMGDGARCEVEYTNEEPVVSSGKRKSVVSLYAPAEPMYSGRP